MDIPDKLTASQAIILSFTGLEFRDPGNNSPRTEADNSSTQTNDLFVEHPLQYNLSIYV